MRTFTDLPETERIAVRGVVEDMGGLVSSYAGGHLSVALPSDGIATAALRRQLREGYSLIMGETITYFPLGSDKPPHGMRHFGPGTAAAPRGDRPSYWCYARFTLKA